ncbi:MAG: DUF3987 domain-containing protein [Methylococcaceae bacterium]
METITEFDSTTKNSFWYTSEQQLLNPPGVLGVISEWVNQTAVSPQPKLSNNAALVVVAALIGQLHQTEQGSSPNLFLVDIARTGAGKEHPRRAVMTLLFELGLPELICGGEISSGQAIIANAQECPVKIYVIDEFGQCLQRWTARNSSPHQRLIYQTFLRLHSSGQTELEGSVYADSSKNQSNVSRPCVNIYGSTTSAELARALSATDCENGFLNRLLLTQAAQDIPDRSRRKENALMPGIPKAVTEWYERLRRSITDPSKPKTVKCDEDAHELLQYFLDDTIRIQNAESEHGLENLIARAPEHCERIALICAVSRNESNPRINIEDASYAINFVKGCVKSMLEFYKENVFESNHQRNMQRILTILGKTKEYKEKKYASIRSKGYMPEELLIKKTGLLKDVFLRHIDTMIASGQVKRYTYKPDGLEKSTYILTENSGNEKTTDSGMGSPDPSAVVQFPLKKPK